MTKFSALFWPMAFVFAALAFTMSANAAQLGYCYPSSGCSGKPSTVTDAGSKTGVSNCASFRRDDNLSQDVNMSACSGSDCSTGCKSADSQVCTSEGGPFKCIKH